LKRNGRVGDHTEWRTRDALWPGERYMQSTTERGEDCDLIEAGEGKGGHVPGSDKGRGRVQNKGGKRS